MKSNMTLKTTAQQGKSVKVLKGNEQDSKALA